MRLRFSRDGRRWWIRALLWWALWGLVGVGAAAQSAGQSAAPYRLRAGRFLAGRGGSVGVTAAASGSAAALAAARRQHAALLAEPRVTALSAPWQAVGPAQVASAAYGAVTGRVTAVAIDPTDATGNTVYLGTTGGGVWKSTNAAGQVASVSFVPLTDTISAFTGNAGTAAIPSLSIGALSVGQYQGQDVILAGTGDPNDATDSYYGSGILRSVDGGNTWALIPQSLDVPAGNHSFFGLGFAGFAWSTKTSGLVVAALSQAAEGVIVDAPSQDNSVMGLYYSTDAGVTWQMATIKDGIQVVQEPRSGTSGGSNAATAVVWNPVRQMFYAAVRFHGYYQSADGMTWTRMAAQPGTGLTTTACPTNPYLAGSTSCPMFRGALAVQPVSGDTFAFTVDLNNADQGIWRDVCGLTGSSCASATATFGTRLTSTGLETGGAIPQGDYDLSLAAVASGTDTLVFAGTVDLYRCSLTTGTTGAAGCVFRNTTNTGDGCSSPAMVAPAQHAVATLEGVGLPLVYLGNDGGLWRSVDGVNEQGSACAASDASHFENLNSGLGSLAEVVSFAQDPSDANTLLVGLGAMGTAATSSAATNTAWAQLAEGEGGVVAIDPATPSNWYISTGAGVNIGYCGAGAACGAADFAGAATIGARQVAGDAALVDAAWMLDPAATAEVLVGTCRGWRGAAASGAQWTGANAISGDFGALGGGALTASCDGTDPLVRSLAAGGPVNAGGSAIENQGSEVLYAGIAGTLDGGNSFAGHVFSTTAGATASDTTVWTDLAESPVVNDTVDSGVFNPGGFDISSLVADPHDATGATVYATVLGFDVPHVYRSVDGGAHWSNISSNLPGAPANSVIVDPNDANTVYVATDTGVYATQAVSSCAILKADCWSALGAGLPNAPVVALGAAAMMPTGAGGLGELRAATYGRGIWEIPLLTASSPARPVMTLNPTALSFAAQSVGSVSATQTVTVTNTGTAALVVSSVVTTGDFDESDSCVGESLAVNQSCTVQMAFLPTAQGVRTGELTIYGNVTGGQATASLSGTGTPEAAIVLTPLSLVFGPTTIGATSTPAQNITVSNLGGTTASLGAAAVTGDFQVSANSCGSSLATQVGCTVSIVFVPTASGARSGSFSITDSAGTQTAILRGTGTAPATDGLAPLTLSFGQQQLTTASATQTVTLTNNGDAALTLIAAAITSGDFTAVNSCGNSLSGHASCTVAVAFVPKQLGQEMGTLTVSDQFRSQTVALNGVGTAPPGVSLAPLGTVAFAATPVGQSSAAQTVTLTNNGDGVLGVTAVAVTGDFQIPAGGNGCGATVAAGAACGIQVVFTPTVAGVRTGTLTVIDSGGSSPQVEALTGTGIDFTLSPDGSTDVTVAGGGSAVYPLLLASPAGVPGTATLSCTGAPANATCVVQPATAPLGATTVITVTVATELAAAGSEGPLEGARRAGVWLAVLLPLGVLGWRGSRGRWRRLLGLCVVAGLLGMGGCGTGRLIPAASGTETETGAGGPGTPTGTSTLTVSATSAGLTQSVSLTLVVQ